MCAAVSARGEDPDALVQRYVTAINDAVADRPAGVTVSMHLCRGNYEGHWMSADDYGPVAERVFGGSEVDALFLEYDSLRAGDFAPLRHVPADTTVVLGLVSSKHRELEPRDELIRRIEDAARLREHRRRQPRQEGRREAQARARRRRRSPGVGPVSAPDAEAARRTWLATVEEHIDARSAPDDDRYWSRRFGARRPRERPSGQQAGHDSGPGRDPPWGGYTAVDDAGWLDHGWQTFASSGTTAAPRLFRYTAFDRDLDVDGRPRYARDGFPPRLGQRHDRVRYGPHVWLWGVHYGLNRMGIPIVTAGGLDSTLRATFIDSYRPTILACTPSYALYLADLMRENGMDPAASSIRYLFCAGDGTLPRTRLKARRIRDLRE